MKYCPECASPLQERIVDDVPRRACKPLCGFVHWDNPIPVAAGLVSLGGRFVLARNARWPVGLFSMITGFVERHETPEQTLLRETTEELGLTGRAAHFIGHYTLERPNQLIVAFHVEAEGVVAPGDEIAEVQLVGPDELARFDFGPLALTARVVRDFLKPATDPRPKAGR